MHIVRNPAAVAALEDPELRDLLEERFGDLAGDQPFDADAMGYFVVVEPGDTVEALEEATGCPILRSWFDDARFGDEDFAPCCEWIAAHGGWYELAYILNDEGFGVGIFVPKDPGIEQTLLALCAAYASPVPERELR